MNQYLHVAFAVALIVSVGWTTLFSLSDKPGIRGFRNLGILASYVQMPVFLFVAAWKAALGTWAAFGLAGGLIYLCWEVFQRLRTPDGEDRPGVSLSPLLHGFFAWPIMVPEAVEYSLAELGVLKTPEATSPHDHAGQVDAVTDPERPDRE